MTSGPSTSGQPAQSTANQAIQNQQQSNLENKKTGKDNLINSLININSSIFASLQSINLDNLVGKDLNHVVPFLTKLLLDPSFTKRRKVLQLLYPIRGTNDLLQLMHARSLDIQDIGSPSNISLFEKSQPRDKLIIVISEYLRIYDATKQSNPNQNATLLGSELFDEPLYIDQVVLCLFALLHKATSIAPINILDMSETLLHVKNGPKFIVRLVANFPERYQEVCYSMIASGERQEESPTLNDVSEQRACTLRILCLLNPKISHSVRDITLQTHKIPSLTIMITLDQLKKAMNKYDYLVDTQMIDSEEDIQESKDIIAARRDLEDAYDNAIAFVIGILLDVEEETRNWFSQYIKFAQKRIEQNHHSVISEFRSRILAYINQLFPSLLGIENHQDDGKNEPISYDNRLLIRATATLRLFCALRGVGMLKLDQEESNILLRLITCKPTVDRTSVNFVTTAVCTLLACSSILSTQKEERKAANWLRWLLEEFNDTDTQSGEVKSSISELLLPIASHFQNNQTSQIADIVCKTLSMKLQVKPSISKCKSLFIQDIFNEKLLSEESSKVPTVKNPATSVEFLPIHSIHQLNGESLGSTTADFMGLLKESKTDQSPHAINRELNDQLIEGFQVISQNPQALNKILKKIIMLPGHEVCISISAFIDNWTKVLDLCPAEQKKLIQSITKLWWRFNAVSPKDLWVSTVNSLRRAQINRSSLEHLWDELTIDPLIVLRCDVRVFRCPEILGIVLHILNAFLAASNRKIQENHDNRNFEELKTTLILAQASAAIQILLESCQPTEEEREILNKKDVGQELTDDEALLLERFDSSTNCICQHLHQVFIADTNLAKLVHFQTYPSELLPITSDKIPSMHICLDFIPELLSQPNLAKQVFVVELTSHLCEKYAITKSLNVAKLCFNVAYTLLQLLPSDKRASFYVPVLPALLKICKVFPILQEDARIILNQINQITLAHMAATSSRLSLGASKPFEGLDKMTWCAVKSLMKSFNLNEALYLCIQKCLIDLDKLEALERQKNPVGSGAGQQAYNSIFAYGSHVINPSRS